MAELVGRALGDYYLVDILGVGGMATVYRGYRRTDSQEVAIKVISSTLATDSNFVKRFEHEAKIAASLQHPHIIKIIDHGEAEGRVYFAMELLNGGSLAQFIREQHTQDEGIAILRQIAEALDFAHQQHIVHRDLKPANVLLDEQKQNAILTDFGVAKLLPDADLLTLLTTDNGLLGTPYYMAPEQWRSGLSVDKRADIYALGVIAYQMLTSKLPYEVSTPFQMMYVHLNEPPIPVRDHRTDLPPAVEIVLNKAMAKDPTTRFETAGAFISALKLALEGITPALTEERSEPATATTEIASRRSLIGDHGKNGADGSNGNARDIIPADKLGYVVPTDTLTPNINALPVPLKRILPRSLPAMIPIVGIIALIAVSLVITIGLRLPAKDHVATTLADSNPDAAATETEVFAESSGTDPVTPKASASTRFVLHYLQELSDPNRKEKRLLVGQAGGRGDDETIEVLRGYHEKVVQKTGKHAAMTGVDFAALEWDEKTFLPYLKEAWTSGQLIIVSWEANNPWSPNSYSRCVPEDCSQHSVLELLEGKTEASKRYLADLEDMGDYLTELRDAGVVVIWKPFICANQDRYWWNQQPPEDFIKLWQYMFHYLTDTRGLNNLLFGYSPSPDQRMAVPVDAYYPGDAYVDLVGIESTYLPGQSHLDLMYEDTYDRLSKLGKPMGIFSWAPRVAEDSKSPRYDLLDLLQELRDSYPRFVFVMAWEWIWSLPEQDNLVAFANDPLVIMQEELPDFKAAAKATAMP